MEYTINKIAKMAGISTRTLRYFGEIGLLMPARVSSSGYRIYGRHEVDRLQQILFYRELGVPLERIKSILADGDFDSKAALQGHLAALIEKRKQLDLLIANVERTIAAGKGGEGMSDEQKFEGFINNLVDENERKFGEEIKQKYGREAVERSNAKVRGMSEVQYAECEELSAKLNEKLKEAVGQGDPASETAQEACELHKRWLCYFWDKYSKEAHVGLTRMYVEDPRFTEYYDKITPGCAVFLRDAMEIFCGVHGG